MNRCFCTLLYRWLQLFITDNSILNVSSFNTQIWIYIFIFSGFFPVAINFLRRIPVLGTILNMPPIGTVSCAHFIYPWINSYDIFSVSGQYGRGSVQADDLRSELWWFWRFLRKQKLSELTSGQGPRIVNKWRFNLFFNHQLTPDYIY